MNDKVNNKNVNVSILKVIAACLVVFLHEDFAGTFGKSIECIARIAVPIFFAVTGYYSYNVSIGKIKNRLIKIIVILLVSNGIYLIWDLFYKCHIGGTVVSEYLKNTFGLKKIATFFLMESALTSYHLWYLTAIVYVYLIYLVYISFWKGREVNYKYLYIYSIIGFTVTVLFALKAQAVNIGEYHWIYRNSLFLGIPLFSMGIFIHEYRERIMENYFFQNKPVTYMLLIASIALGLIQYFGIGVTDYPVMLTYVVFVLVLYTTGSENSKKIKNPGMLSDLLNRMSLIIYIIHLLVHNIFVADYEHKKIFGEISQNGYVFPLVVLMVSVLIAFILSICVGCLNSQSEADVSKN